MKTIMLKIQIILTIVIVVGVYLHVAKGNGSSGLNMNALDPMARGVEVDSNDTFDILKANLGNGEQQSPEKIANDLFNQAMQSPNAPKNVNSEKQSEMMQRAQSQAQQMLQSGNVSKYRQELDKNTIMKRIMGE